MNRFSPQPKQGIVKKEKKPLKRSSLKKTVKPTGEKAVFQSIAESRPWFCFVSGVKLNGLSASNFAHCLSKAKNKYPHFKLYEPNIVLLADVWHHAWDHTPRSSLVHPMWDKMKKLEKELINDYNKLYGTNGRPPQNNEAEGL